MLVASPAPHGELCYREHMGLGIGTLATKSASPARHMCANVHILRAGQRRLALAFEQRRLDLTRWCCPELLLPVLILVAATTWLAQRRGAAPLFPVRCHEM